MVSLGIIGAGNWGRNHARVALELLAKGILDEVVVCDTDRARLKPWEGRARTTTAVAEVLAAGVTAVILATPADTHYDVARMFLEAGVHVLAEKPMTLGAADAASLARLAERKGLVLMPGHIFRYHPAIEELRARIEKGFFGDIRLLSTVRTSFVAPRTDVGVLYSLGIHEADLYPYLLGHEYPVRASALVASFHRPEIDEAASLQFDFGEACFGFAFESWVSPGRAKERRLTLVGTRASAEVDYQDLKSFTVYGSMMEHGARPRFSEGDAEIVHTSGREPLREEVEDFVKAVASGGRHRPRADAGSGVRAVEIIEALKAKGQFTARES